MLFSILLSSVVFYITWQWMRRRNFHPGPFPLPLVGSLYVMRRGVDMFRQLADLRHKYGALTFFQFFSRDGLIINNFSAAHEAYVKNAEAFSHRPNFSVFKYQGNGVALANGERWRLLRKHTMCAMRDLGVGKCTLEERIKDEAAYLVESFEACVGGCDPKKHVVRAVSNIVASVVFGERFEYENPKFQTVVHEIETTFRTKGPTNPMVFFPEWLEPLTTSSFLPQLIAMNEKVFALIDESVTRHRTDFDPNHIRDFVDIFLANEKEGTLSQEHLRHTIRDLFVAGTDTTANTLAWMFLHLLNNPEIQDKMHEEIDRVLEGRGVTMSDKPGMPYVEAVILETLRDTPPTTLCPPRYTACDVEISGHVVPRHTTCFLNIWSCHHDPEYWTDPHQFRPERWLDSKGAVIHGAPSFLPFSFGKRSCVGEILAKMELFLFTVSLLQKFTLRPVPGEEVPPVAGVQGTTYMPNSYSLLTEVRK